MKTSTWRILAIVGLALIWLTSLLFWNTLSGTVARAQSPARPVTTPTHTPTSMPGPPTLLAPGAGVTLPQPVPPDEWLFQWSARTGPCYSILTADGPNGWSISAYVHYNPNYEYHYTRTAAFPPSALGQWNWHVKVQCPSGASDSKVRPFYLVTTTLTNLVYLPIITQ